MGTHSLVWRWGRSGSGAELDDGVAFDGRQPAGGQHGTGEELLVRLVDVEHDVAELLEVLRGEVADRGDLQFRPADTDHVTGADRVPPRVCDGRWTMLISASASGSGSPKRMATPAAAMSAASGPTSTTVVR